MTDLVFVKGICISKKWSDDTPQTSFDIVMNEITVVASMIKDRIDVQSKIASIASVGNLENTVMVVAKYYIRD
jgi:hypothetical protein